MEEKRSNDKTETIKKVSKTKKRKKMNKTTDKIGK